MLESEEAQKLSNGLIVFMRRLRPREGKPLVQVCTASLPRSFQAPVLLLYQVRVCVQHKPGVWVLLHSGAWASQEVPAQCLAPEAAPEVVLSSPPLAPPWPLPQGPAAERRLPSSPDSRSLEIRALIITTVETCVERLLPHGSDHLMT